ncbi:MAG: helix-hairpin-helix domain-containing protein, partial [Promethearchaeota archaeon]
STKKGDITCIKGVGVTVAQKLRNAGFNTVEEIANSSSTQLSIIKGIGTTTAQKIINEAVSVFTQRNLQDFQNDEEKPIVSFNDSRHVEFIESSVKAIQNGRSKREDYNSGKWFGDEFKKPKSGVWVSPPSNQEEKNHGTNEETSILEDDKEDEAYDFEEISEEEEEILENTAIRSTQDNLMPKQSKSIILTEKISLAEKNSAINNIILILKSQEYRIIKNSPNLKKIYSKIDLIAFKIITVADYLEIMIFVPLKYNTFKGGLKISNKTLDYIPFNQSDKEEFEYNLKMNTYVVDLSSSYKMIRNDFLDEGILLSHLKNHYEIDISLETTITKKKLFFHSGTLQYRIVIDPILLCEGDVKFLEKIIPFTYLEKKNVYIIRRAQLEELLGYLEKKYSLIESHYPHKNSLISYKDIYNHFLDQIKRFSFPFIGFGIILLILSFFQMYSFLVILLNLGYALIGFYPLIIGYFYMRFFKEKKEIRKGFSNLYHRKKLGFSDTSLILINEELGVKFMPQFVYECVEKYSNSNFISKMEENHAKEQLQRTQFTTNFENGNFFEGEQPPKPLGIKKDSISKYSSFLED